VSIVAWLARPDGWSRRGEELGGQRVYQMFHVSLSISLNEIDDTVVKIIPAALSASYTM
jgi:hypothetical protein